MRTVSLLELIDLVYGDVEEAESRIQKLFEWRFERDMNIAKWALGLAASLIIAVLVAFFRGGSDVTGRELGIGLAIAFASATYGIFAIVQLRSVNREFIAALVLYSRFRSIRAFIRLYRNP
ncbi:MAG: hypothetical protein IH989_08270 [Planctomycetes bacterium]|nr:hypothetical protein [Planctomycetota bacterium]